MKAYPSGQLSTEITPFIEPYNDGMDLRDYFAAKVIQGIVSNPTLIDSFQTGAITSISGVAYIVADAMMKAREVKP